MLVFVEVVDSSQAADANARGVGGVFVGTDSVGLLQSDDFQSTMEASPRPFVATDEEGGRVQRLSSIIGPPPSAREMRDAMTPSQIASTVERHSQAMARLGVAMDFAPDADVSDEPDDAVIGDRTFSNDPQAVTADAVAFAKSLQASRVTPVFKHFPGHGHASGDSHIGLATTPPLSALHVNDLVPFTKGLHLVSGAAVMIGH